MEPHGTKGGVRPDRPLNTFSVTCYESKVY